MYGLQRITSDKGTALDPRHRLGNAHTGQRGAVVENHSGNHTDTISDGGLNQIVAVAEQLIAQTLNAAGERDALQLPAVEERRTSDIGHRAGDGDIGQLGATERGSSDFLHAVRDLESALHRSGIEQKFLARGIYDVVLIEIAGIPLRHGDRTCHEKKRFGGNIRHTGRNIKTLQSSAPVKGILPDALHRVGDHDGFQIVAVIKRAIADLLHAGGDGIGLRPIRTHQCIEILDQPRLLRIEQRVVLQHKSPVVGRERHGGFAPVERVALHRGKAAAEMEGLHIPAVTECAFFNGRHTVRDDHIDKLRLPERTSPNGHDAVRNGDLGNTTPGECIVADGGQCAGQLGRSQVVAIAECVAAHGGDAGLDDHSVDLAAKIPPRRLLVAHGAGSADGHGAVVSQHPSYAAVLDAACAAAAAGDLCRFRCFRDLRRFRCFRDLRRFRCFRDLRRPSCVVQPQRQQRGDHHQRQQQG